MAAEISGIGWVIMKHGSSPAGYGSAGGQPERRASPKGPMPRVVVRQIPRHGTSLPGDGPLAQSEKLRGFGGWPPRSRCWTMSCLTAPCSPAGSYAVVLRVAPFARSFDNGRVRSWHLVRDTGRQAVAATVDGDDLGAVQQAVEDGSGGGHVA